MAIGRDPETDLSIALRFAVLLGLDDSLDSSYAPQTEFRVPHPQVSISVEIGLF
jgi:hypothetical protein